MIVTRPPPVESLTESVESLCRTACSAELAHSGKHVVKDAHTARASIGRLFDVVGDLSVGVHAPSQRHNTAINPLITRSWQPIGRTRSECSTTDHCICAALHTHMPAGRERQKETCALVVLRPRLSFIDDRGAFLSQPSPSSRAGSRGGSSRPQYIRAYRYAGLYGARRASRGWPACLLANALGWPRASVSHSASSHRRAIEGALSLFYADASIRVRSACA